MRTKGFGGCFCVLALLTSACDRQRLDEAGTGVETVEQELYYDAGHIADDSTLSVCWLSLDYATERGWVREAVERAYEPITGIEFTGWGLCNLFVGADIVISHTNDADPHATGKRTLMSATNMWLNPFIGQDDLSDFWHCFSDRPDSSTPRTGVTGRYFPSHRQRCVETTAVHEFSHAIGIEHEQGRADRPSACSPSGGVPGRIPYGYFDWTSVSNYCNPAWNNDGFLSPLDVSWLVETYGMKTNDHVWYGIGNVRDYGSVSADTLMFDIRSQSVSGSYAPQIGDFDGSGEDDVFWYQAGSGTDPIWWGQEDRTFDNATGPTVTSTYAMATADFDDDGKDDIFLHAPGSTADRVLWGREDGGFDNVATSHNINGTFVPLAGDFDGDENADIFLYAAGSTMDVIWWGNDNRTFTSEDAQENVNVSYVPIVGDFDADGRSDIFWYEPGSLGAEIIWWGRSDGTFDETTVSDISGTYVPTAGDFDGNGADDIIFSKSNDEQDPVYLFSDTTRGTYVSSKTSSVLGSNPYAGDFDGDGLDDVFWYVGN